MIDDGDDDNDGGGDCDDDDDDCDDDGDGYVDDNDNVRMKMNTESCYVFVSKCHQFTVITMCIALIAVIDLKNSLDEIDHLNRYVKEFEGTF